MNKTLLLEDIFRRLFLCEIKAGLFKDLALLASELKAKGVKSEFLSLFAPLASDEKACDELRWEFNSLFLIKPKVVPYESAYFGAGLYSQRCEMVREFYARAGVRAGARAFADDYIGYELEFLHLLSALALNGEQGALGLRKEFIKTHACSWFIKFSQDLQGAKPSPFWLEFCQCFSAYSDILITQGE